MTSPAGWYDDPQDPQSIRYWDGAQWTTAVSPKTAFPSTAPRSDAGPSNPMHYIVPIGRSWQSVVAPYLGLLSLLSVPIIGHVLGIGGIVLGVIALRRARTGGHGTGRAITAIVLGSIGTLTSTVLLLGLIAGAFSS